MWGDRIQDAVDTINNYVKNNNVKLYLYDETKKGKTLRLDENSDLQFLLTKLTVRE